MPLWRRTSTRDSTRAAEDLHLDKEVVLAAVAQNGCALQFFVEDL